MAHCIECGELEEHDMDCSQHPAADNSGLHIYRLGDVEALRSENMKLRMENKRLWAALGKAPEEPRLGCLDCGLPYEEFGLDTVLSLEEWRVIHPDERGVLCANCIVRRASNLDGVTRMEMQLGIELVPSWTREARLREDNERVMNLFRWSEENCTRAKLLRLVTVQDGQLQELCAVLASAPEPWQPSRISAREWDAVYCGWYRLTAEWRRSDDIR